MNTTRLLAAAAGIAALAAPAFAQNSDDHLTCYKIQDPTKVSATATLDTAGLGVSSDCKISKAAMLCAPSDLQGLVTDGTAALPVSGPRSTGQRICYKVKCPAPYPVSEQVSDEFGTRTVAKFKTSMVCAPAVAGAVLTHGGFDHYPRGLAELSETSTSDGPTLHVASLDGLPSSTPDSAKSLVSDPGGSGVVVVLQNASSFGVRVRSNQDSRASLRNSELRVGAVLNVRGHGGTRSESMMDAVSVGAGTSGVSTTAYFPRLQRLAGAGARTATVTCMGAPVGSSTETTPGDPNWTFFSSIWPDRYETASNATTDEATFTWETGCVEIRPPDASGVALVGDRLVISMDNGSDPQQLHRAQITGAGGLAAFALKDEVTH